MASRVTKLSRRTLAQPDANARVTKLSRRTLAQPDATARVTKLSRRVLITDYVTVGAAVRVTIVD